MFDLTDKVVIITGSSSGIGASIATTFINQGAQVIGFDLQKHSQINTLEIDVSDAQQVEQGIKQVIKNNRHIDCLINNAGVALIGSVEDTSEEDYDRIFSINAKGVYLCMRAVVPVMKQQQQGVIINMASVAASCGIEQRFAYSATKGAVRAMTMAAAKDLIPYNIRCNCISPARVHTPFVDDYLEKNYPGKEEQVYKELSETQPVGRMGTPQEVATLALYLCSDQAAFITGSDYPIDGGFLTLNT